MLFKQMSRVVVWFMLTLLLASGISCTGGTNRTAGGGGPGLYFLSDIRPNYFSAMDWGSATKMQNLSNFFVQFTKTYNYLEANYKAGSYTSSSDLQNMKLASLYYAFFLTSLTRANLDGYVDFATITRGRQSDLFAQNYIGNPNFQQKELEAMMVRAMEVAKLGYAISGNNRGVLGYILAAQQVYGRTIDPGHKNNMTYQTQLINYGTEPGIDRTLYYKFPNWDLMLCFLLTDDYSDPNNTFGNPDFNKILADVNLRFTPANIPDLGINFVPLLAPMYRMDILLKKADWMIQNGLEMQNLPSIVAALANVTAVIESGRQKELLLIWDKSATYYQRKAKVAEVTAYSAGISLNNGTSLAKPDLQTLFVSKEFKQVYQCYSCHKSPI